ncbi:MAG: hypothetical protein HOW97_17605, partial [Catenulispora sp.]|nr:hypothetical protein [Catenulispora sp.]
MRGRTGSRISATLLASLLVVAGATALVVGRSKPAGAVPAYQEGFIAFGSSSNGSVWT